MTGRRAVFLDRDGVINALVREADQGAPESPLRVEDVRLLAGCAAGARLLRSAGYLLVCVTNQPAAAKGKISLGGLAEIQARVEELLAVEGVVFDRAEMRVHHPQGSERDLAIACGCRKPRPGMLVDASALGIDLGESWIVGDTDADVAAGRAVGCRTVLVDSDAAASKRTGVPSPDLTAPDLAGAAGVLVAELAHC